MSLTEREMLQRLYAHFSRWAMVTEVTTQDTSERGAPDRRVDVLLLQRDRRMAVEVKVTRGDLLADVREPRKQAPWRRLCHQHAYAVPAGLASPGDVPAASGLLFVHEQQSAPSYHHATWARRAPVHKAEPLPPRTLHALLCRLAAAEAVRKGLVAVDTGDPVELRERLALAERDRTNAQAEADRARERAKAWQALAAAREPLPCSHCWQPLRFSWSSRRGPVWQHVEPAHEAACEVLRRELDEADRAAGGYGWRRCEPADLDPTELEESPRMRKWAAVSEDERYRYSLHRRWDEPGEPPSTVVFVMLNPSTADAEVDDPTVRRCVAFARSWGHNRLAVVNLHAYRATKPQDMPEDLAEATGPDNVTWVAQELAGADLVVLAWGANAAAPSWLPPLLDRLRPGVPVRCLGMTKGGQPRHPLFVAGAVDLTPWRVPTA